MHVDKTLDARKWYWPWNILKAKSLLKEMKPGDILQVIVSGPRDMETFVDVLEKSGYELSEVIREIDDYRLFIKCAHPKRTFEAVDHSRHNSSNCTFKKTTNEE